MKLQHRFEVFQSLEDKQYYFRCVHRNGNIKFVSEGYKKIGDCVESLNNFADDLKINEVPVQIIRVAAVEIETDELPPPVAERPRVPIDFIE